MRDDCDDESEGPVARIAHDLKGFRGVGEAESCASEQGSYLVEQGACLPEQGNSVSVHLLHGFISAGAIRSYGVAING
jgi:hypothetical protein